MELSNRIACVSASATIAITSRAKAMRAEGVDVVDFGAGEPDFDTPAFIKDAAKAALDGGDTKYVPQSAGGLKAAISQKLARENGLDLVQDQIAVTFGGKHALHVAFQVLLNPGEKVLIPSPYWTSYPEQVKLASGQPVFLETRSEEAFKISPEQLLSAAKGAKILLLNSPCNPTGVTYTPAELSALARAVLKTDLWVFSDEI